MGRCSMGVDPRTQGGRGLVARSRRWWLGALVLGAVGLGAGAGAPALAAGTASGGTLYQSYCAGCHGDLSGSGGHRAAPDLRELTNVHGAPLPRAALLRFVLDPLRRGVPRVCSERPFAWASPGLGTWAMRRGAVLDVLRYLETVQHPAGRPSGSSEEDG